MFQLSAANSDQSTTDRRS